MSKSGTPSSPAPGAVSAPMTLAEAWQRANALHAAGDLPAALSLYRAIVQTAPQFPDALRWLGVVLA
jgi:hypothetical protein